MTSARLASNTSRSSSGLSGPSATKRSARLRRLQLKLDDAPSVELACPGAAAVTAGEHGAGVADGEAVLGIGESHCGEGDTDWCGGLCPALAAVIGDNNNAALADCDPARAGLGYAQQHGMLG